MAGNPAKVYEGVFAFNKPSGVTSAQAIRDVQSHFNPSPLFRSWLDQERARRDLESRNPKQRGRSSKHRQPLQLKMGHGGTLDPMATGVLVLGVGSGTKALNSFLTCTKTYEAVVLFGMATDTYDAAGRVVAQQSYQHITREMVEEALEKFTGRIMQRPPIFSALRVQGKRLYEYAREGKEVPVEIQEREVRVEELELVEWMEGGTHKCQWPTRKAGTPERRFAEKTLHLGERESPDTGSVSGAGAKRKREQNGSNPTWPDDAKRPKTTVSPEETDGIRGSPAPQADNIVAAQDTGATLLASTPCPAAACRLRMTVSSGFYVRSLCHDLGAAVGSLALMSSLVRTRQGDFKLGENVLEYSDLSKGEPIWEPKVRSMLEAWNAEEETTRSPEGQRSTVSDTTGGSTEATKRQRMKVPSPPRAASRRRNSSSDEG